MTDERWEELTQQVAGLVRRDDRDCAHRILQEMLEERIRHHGADDPMAAATRVILGLFCARLGRDEEARRLMQQAESVLLAADEKELLALSLSWRAVMAVGDRDYATAVRLFRRCLQLYQEGEEPPRPIDVLACRKGLAESLVRQGRAEEGMELLRQIMEDTRPQTPEEASLAAHAALELGEMCLNRKRLADATVALCEAEALYGQAPHIHPTEVALLHWHLARVALGQHDLQEGQRHCTRSLELHRAPAMGDLPGGPLLGLGQVRALQRRMPEAVDLLRQAVAAAEEVGEDAPGLLELCLSELGRAYVELHRYEDAEPHLTRAVRLMQGRTDEEFRRARQALATARQGRRVPVSHRGIRSEQDLLDQCRRERGEAALRDPRYGETFIKHGAHQKNQGRWDRAGLCFRAAQVVFENAHGHDHESVADAICAWATSLLQQGLAREAEAGFREALAILGRIGRQGRVGVGAVLHGIGAVLLQQDRFDEAIDMLSQAVVLLEKESPAVAAGAMLNLGMACDRSGRSEEAERWLLKAMGVLQRPESGRPPAHVARDLRELAGCYSRRGDYKLAEAVLDRAIRVAQQVPEQHRVVAHLQAQHAWVLWQIRRSRQE